MPAITLTRYTDDSTRITGGKLDGVKVLDWGQLQDSVVWMDECGDLNLDPVAGHVLVASRELPPSIRTRAAITNAENLKDVLERIRTNHCVDVWKESVWLGVTARKDTQEEKVLPPWALGVEIVEEQEPIGCFAALGYVNKDKYRASLYAGMEDYYLELLIWHCDEDGVYHEPSESTESRKRLLSWGERTSHRGRRCPACTVRSESENGHSELYERLMHVEIPTSLDCHEVVDCYLRATMVAAGIRFDKEFFHGVLRLLATKSTSVLPGTCERKRP